MEKQMYIGGKWVESLSGKRFESENPATGEIVGTVPRGHTEDIAAAVSAAKEAFPGWRDTPVEERGRWLLRIAQAIRRRAEEIALLHAQETGHYLRKSQDLVEFSSQLFEFHAGLGDKARGASIPTGPGQLSLIRLEPVGVTGHIVPWNYPLYLVIRSVAPAMVLGNTAVVKPAEQTPLITLALAEVIEEVGLPAGVFNVVTGFGEEAGEPLAAHPDVRSIAFTGSVQTGQLVMKAAASHMAKLTLELGGKTPVIVFPDVDVDMVVEAAMQGILSRCGQCCFAGSRLFLHDEIHDEVLQRLVERFGKVKLGDTLDPDTQMGPIISREQLERVERYVEIGKREGAELLVGGARPADPKLQKGYFYLPTIFANVTTDMRIAQEEIFGPVLAVLRWNDEEEMLRQANGVQYGLAAAVWCREAARALRTAIRLEAGSVYVNEWISSDFKACFGGCKMSGMGREEGLECIENYTERKYIAISLQDRKTENWCDAPL